MTVTHRPARTRVTRDDCLKFYGTGRTAGGLRAMAADPKAVAMTTTGSGEPAATVRAMMLDLADGIDQLAAEGITPADCWDLLGWDAAQVEAVLGGRDGGR